MSDSNDFDNCEPKAVGNVRPFRRILAQVLIILETVELQLITVDHFAKILLSVNTSC